MGKNHALPHSKLQTVYFKTNKNHHKNPANPNQSNHQAQNLKSTSSKLIIIQTLMILRTTNHKSNNKSKSNKTVNKNKFRKIMDPFSKKTKIIANYKS